MVEKDLGHVEKATGEVRGRCQICQVKGIVGVADGVQWYLETATAEPGPFLTMDPGPQFSGQARNPNQCYIILVIPRHNWFPINLQGSAVQGSAVQRSAGQCSAAQCRALHCSAVQ